MAQRTIRKTDLRELADAVRKDGRFYGPVKADEGEALSESFNPDDGASLNYYNFKLPAKRLFFPHTEVICTYDAETMTDVPLPEEKVVIFGMRPENIYDPECEPPCTDAAPVTAMVDVTEIMGSEIFLHLVADGKAFMARVNPRCKARPGQVIRVEFDMARMHVFDPETEQAIGSRDKR